MIDGICHDYNYYRPRMYHENARRGYLNLAKCKKRMAKKIRKAIKQQRYMNENQVHTVPDRIVSISQPYIRPIVRGKAAAPVEFGVKLDLSIDENGMARLEKLFFDAYNESDVLIGTIEGYRERTGHYPTLIMLIVWKWKGHSA